MGKVINLNRYRKQKAKAERAARADVNRRLHGRTKAEVTREALQKRRLTHAVDGAKLERGTEEGSADAEAAADPQGAAKKHGAADAATCQHEGRLPTGTARERDADVDATALPARRAPRSEPSSDER